MFDYDQLYHRHALPRVNPLIEASPGDTARTVASVLSVLRAVDVTSLDDAGPDGLNAILLTATAALEAAADLEEPGGLWIDAARAERIREIASRDGCGVDTLLERALASLEATPHTDPASTLDTRARYARVRDLAQTWIDALDQAPAASDGGQTA